MTTAPFRDPDTQEIREVETPGQGIIAAEPLQIFTPKHAEEIASTRDLVERFAGARKEAIIWTTRTAGLGVAVGGRILRACAEMDKGTFECYLLNIGVTPEQAAAFIRARRSVQLELDFSPQAEQDEFPELSPEALRACSFAFELVPSKPVVEQLGDKPLRVGSLMGLSLAFRRWRELSPEVSDLEQARKDTADVYAYLRELHEGGAK